MCLCIWSQTTAYVPELQKLNGVQAAKAVGKPRKQAPKGEDSKDDDKYNSGDGSESDGEEIAENVKSKKRQKLGGQVKQPSSRKRKSKESDTEDDDGGNDDDGGGSDDNAEEAPKTKSGKVTKNKQAKAVTTSKEKVISQKGKPSKKKAK